MIESGLQIDGFTLVGEIGRGGFGVVHRARRAGSDQDVAVKVLASGRMPEDAVRRFERECLVLEQLSSHPNIVTFLGSGFTRTGEPFIVMEYLARGSLADRLTQAGSLTWQEACSHVVKVAGALETAHQAGILHRDVKPQNILLSATGEPMLADFGIALVHDGTHSQSGAITASLAHAAPEVLDGRPPIPSSDVYALSSSLFHLVSGSLAFDPGRDGVVAMIGKVLNRPVPDLRSLRVPDGVCDVIEHGMAKTPGARPASAAEFGERLVAAAAAAGHVVDLPQIGSTLPMTAASEGGAEVVVEPAPSRRAATRSGRTLVDPAEVAPVLTHHPRPSWLLPVLAVVALVVAVTVATRLIGAG